MENRSTHSVRPQQPDAAGGSYDAARQHPDVEGGTHVAVGLQPNTTGRISGVEHRRPAGLCEPHGFEKQRSNHPVKATRACMEAVQKLPAELISAELTRLQSDGVDESRRHRGLFVLGVGALTKEENSVGDAFCALAQISMSDPERLCDHYFRWRGEYRGWKIRLYHTPLVAFSRLRTDVGTELQRICFSFALVCSMNADNDLGSSGGRVLTFLSKLGTTNCSIARDLRYLQVVLRILLRESSSDDDVIRVMHQFLLTCYKQSDIDSTLWVDVASGALRYAPRERVDRFWVELIRKAKNVKFQPLDRGIAAIVGLPACPSGDVLRGAFGSPSGMAQRRRLLRSSKDPPAAAEVPPVRAGAELQSQRE